MTVLQKELIDQLRRVRLEEKRLRVGALGYDAGEFDLGDLVLASVQYAAAVRVYRAIERELLACGVRVPPAVRNGGTSPSDWEPVQDVEVTQPCEMRRGSTIQ